MYKFGKRLSVTFKLIGAIFMQINVPQSLSLVVPPSRNKIPNLSVAFAKSPLDLIFGLNKNSK